MDNNTIPNRPLPQQPLMRPRQNTSADWRNFFEFIWRLRYWMVGAAVAALILAFFLVRMQTPVFQRNAWLMLNGNDGADAQVSLLADLTGTSVSKKVDDEVFILKSPTLMGKVVEQYGMNKRYYQYRMPIGDRVNVARGLFAKKKTEMYGRTAFDVDIAVDSVGGEAAKLPESFSFRFSDKKNVSYTVKRLRLDDERFSLSKDSYKYGEPMQFPGFKVYVTLNDASLMRRGDRYAFSYQSPFKAAQDYLKDLTVTINGTRPTDKGNAITLSYEDAIPERAEDILNTLYLESNRESRDYANMASVNTVQFIDLRLAELAEDLGDAEGDYKRYQASNTVVDLASQGQLAVNNDMTYQNQLVEVRLQQKVLDMIADYLKANSVDEYQVIPSNIGISDVGLNTIIDAYNQLLAERNRLIANSSANNPRVLSMNSQLEDSKKSIEVSVANLVNVYKIRENELTSTLRDSRRRMTAIPEQQFEVQQLSRRIDIIEPLYLMLQQKREEAQISMYAQADNFRLIEAAFGPEKPISPQSKKIYALAFLLGLCIPPLFVWLRTKLKTRVETKKDVTDVIKDTDVIAVLPRASKDFKLISEKGRDAVSESFRMLRSNLQYMKDVKVIQVTSSMPKEGKSYVASNLAVSIAHRGKKVLLIGMDIRKPVLRTLFPEVKADNDKSVVGWLMGRCSDLDLLPNPSAVNENLDVVFAGPVPYNPTELLSQDNLGDMIAYYREKYDYVVIDSAPYLPVSDAGLINGYVDATLYLIRAGQTELNLLPDVKEALNNTTKPVKRVSLVINDLDLESKKYHYGYGNGYGYGYGHKAGYGYGYGYGYGDENEKN